MTNYANNIGEKIFYIITRKSKWEFATVNDIMALHLIFLIFKDFHLLLQAFKRRAANVLLTLFLFLHAVEHFGAFAWRRRLLARHLPNQPPSTVQSQQNTGILTITQNTWYATQECWCNTWFLTLNGFFLALCCDKLIFGVELCFSCDVDDVTVFSFTFFFSV